MLALISDGATYAEAAVNLHLAHSTVKAHMFRISMKLGARNAPHAVALAIRSGEIE